MAPPLALLLAAWVVAGADGGTATPPLPAAAVTVDWRGAPLAVTPMVATVHDVSAGASGNPHHDGRESVYPPTKYDIVDALAQRRRELAPGWRTPCQCLGRAMAATCAGSRW